VSRREQRPLIANDGKMRLPPPLQEGLVRKGGRNTTPVNTSARPPAPPAFRPSPAPAPQPAFTPPQPSAPPSPSGKVNA
jgi:hypothetical protein